MPGLLTQPAPTPSDPASAPTPDTAASAPTAPLTKGQMDPILMKVRAGVESKLPPELKDSVERIVVAGLKLLYDPSTHPQVQRIYDAIAQGGFQPTAIATGMVNLLGMIQKSSGGKMSVPAAYPAGVILLTYILDDLEKMKGLKVSDQLVKDIGKQMMQMFVKAFGINQGGPSTPTAPPPSQPTQPAAAPAGV
jgi:hypothetical protein